MNKQRGGTVRLFWLLALLLATVVASAAMEYVTTTGHRGESPHVSRVRNLIQPATTPNDSNVGVVHSFPDAVHPPPCGSFETICYISV